MYPSHLTPSGYGDFSPSTRGGRLFCVVFALGGVAFLAIALGVAGSKIIEAQVSTISKAEDEIVKDVMGLFPSQNLVTKEDKQRSFQKQSSKSSSYSYLDDFDDPIQSLRDQLHDFAHPWHAVKDFCAGLCSVLARYLPALTPLLVGASIIGHFEGWTWDDVLYYCVVTTTT
jgi:hypothetical protein